MNISDEIIDLSKYPMAFPSITPGYLGLESSANAVTYGDHTWKYDKKKISFFICRDVFNGWAYQDMSQNIFYVLEPLRTLEQFASYMDDIEDHFKIQEKSTFYRCASPDTMTNMHVVAIKPCLWWRKQPLRYNFLTIAIRSFMIHDDKRHWRRTLEMSSYLANKTQLDKFLDGKTYWPVPSFAKENAGFGWQYIFNPQVSTVYKLNYKQRCDTLVDLRGATEIVAARKWEEAGKPVGRDAEFWYAAEKELL